MGIGGISMWQLLVLLLIVVLVFGTKRLRSMGSDLGAAVKGFRKGMEDEKDKDAERLEADSIGADANPSPSSSETADKNPAGNDAVSKP